MAVDGVPGYLRFRIVNRITGVDIVTDLKHPHTSTWTVKGMQQGAPASSAIGTFRIPLFPPGSEEYKRNWADYSKLLPGSGEGYRVEAYRGDVGTGSAPWQAGIITAVNIDTSGQGTFELTGFTDPWVAQAGKFFPGETTSADAGATNSVDRFKRFLGENILTWSDQFNPYVPANYAIVNGGAGRTSPVFTGTTDQNGVNPNVIKTTGVNGVDVGGYLVSQTGITASNDPDRSFLIEFFVRLTVANIDNTFLDCFMHAGLSTSPSAIVGGAAGAFVLGVDGNSIDSTGLTNLQDADGFISLHVQVLINKHQVTTTINGSQATSAAGYDAGTTTHYPYLSFFDDTVPAHTTLVAAYITNFAVGTRNTANVLTTTAPFIAGTTDSPAHSLMPTNVTPPTFLDGWSMCAALEGWYWRYTPVSMVAGTHPTMGKVDLRAAPGTDRSSSVRFVEGENLVSLRMQGNADLFASDLQLNGNPASNSGGVVSARNLTAMATYGWLTDVGTSMTVTEYNGFRLQANSVLANKVAPGASVIATVLRDPDTADVWRELDYVTIHAPSYNLNNKKLLVLAYTYTEGQDTQQITLGQYGNDAAGLHVTGNRLLPAIALVAGAYKSR